MNLPVLSRLTEQITAYAGDVTHLMPADWAFQVATCSRKNSRWQTLAGTSVTSSLSSTSRQNFGVDPEWMCLSGRGWWWILGH